MFFSVSLLLQNFARRWNAVLTWTFPIQAFSCIICIFFFLEGAGGGKCRIFCPFLRISAFFGLFGQNAHFPHFFCAFSAFFRRGHGTKRLARGQICGNKWAKNPSKHGSEMCVGPKNDVILPYFYTLVKIVFS